ASFATRVVRIDYTASAQHPQCADCRRVADGASPSPARPTEPAAQPPKSREVAEIGGGLRFLGSLQNLRHPREATVVQQEPERGEPEEAAADVLMAVEPRAEGRL